MKRALRYGFQPLTLVFALGVWISYPTSELIFLTLFVSVLILISALEYIIPARRDWRMPPLNKLGQAGVWLVLFILFGVFAEIYVSFAVGPLTRAREQFGLTIWPNDLPLLVQAFMLFFASEFIWYWLHRAEHRWAFVWRASGHGAHHAYKKLNVLNSGLNHPFEFLLLVAPTITLELLFGIGTATTGALLLLTLQTLFAHANLDLNSSVIGWVFTTNKYHIHHHSAVFHESNTNFGCATIIWDHLFGTFSDEDTQEVGTGPSEPSLWQKAVMPFTEPADTATSP